MSELTPEEQAALERCRTDSYQSTIGGELQVLLDMRLLVGAMLREHPAAEQPVDWPTSPGWWWVSPAEDDIDPQLCAAFDDKIRIGGIYYSKQVCEWYGYRFLPGPIIPTFPPRENK